MTGENAQSIDRSTVDKNDGVYKDIHIMHLLNPIFS